MATGVTGEIATGFHQEMCEYRWKILNWLRVQQSKEAIENQKIVIETGGLAQFKSKWEIGLMEYHPERQDLWRVYCKLISAPEAIEEPEYTINIQILNNENNPWQIFSKDGKIKEGDCLQTDVHYFVNCSEEYATRLDADGSLGFLVIIKIMIPHTLASNAQTIVTAADFSTPFVAQMQNNLGALINDPSSADLKIVTSDEMELHVHQFILKVQCPVFASMFRSHFSENVTGTVVVEDICEKTMKILLHFFYTGKLLPTWSDADTIVEFTYAAGKYQMTEVLRMLDSVLGTTDKNETSSFDLQLLNVAHKLSLTNAEARLVKRVMKKTAKIENTTDLLAFLGTIRVEENSSENLDVNK